MIAITVVVIAFIMAIIDDITAMAIVIILATKAYIAVIGTAANAAFAAITAFMAVVYNFDGYHDCRGYGRRTWL